MCIRDRSDSNALYVSQITQNIISNELVEDLNDDTYFKHNWIASGQNFYYYYFIVLMNPNEFTTFIPTMPFDYITWVLIVVSFFVVYSFLLFVSQKWRIMKYQKTFVDYIKMYGLLVGQRVKFIDGCTIRDNFQTNIIRFTWILISVILCEAYRKSIFTFLTHPMPPVVHTTLKELTESDIQMVTLESFSRNGTLGSMVHIKILPALMTGRAGVDYPSYLETFKMSLQYAAVSYTHLRAHET